MRKVNAVISLKKRPIIQILSGIILAVFTTFSHAQEEAQAPDAQNAEQKEDSSETKPPPPKVERAKILTKAQIEKRQQMVIAEKIDDGEVVWLNAEGEEFLALWQKDLSGEPLGAVLMLHHTGQTVDWPRTLKNLRQNLSEHGWSTLSISLPSPNLTPVPKRTFPKLPPKKKPPAEGESSEAEDGNIVGDDSISAESPPPAAETEEKANTDNAEPPTKESEDAPPEQEEKAPPKPVEPIAEARIQAAMQFLYDKGQFNLALLGDGLGASRGARYANKSANKEMSAQLKKLPRGAKADKPFRAIILLNALNTIKEDPEFNLVEVFSYNEIPVLDIIYYNNPSIQKAFRERAFSAKQAALQIYMQKKILAPNDADSHTLNPKARSKENRTTRIIRGFLSKHAKGVSVPK